MNIPPKRRVLQLCLVGGGVVLGLRHVDEAPTVQRYGRAVDVPARRAGQEERGARHVLFVPDALQRDRAHNLLSLRLQRVRHHCPACQRMRTPEW